MVAAIFDWVTFGLIEPGVRAGSGKPAGDRGIDGATDPLLGGEVGKAARGPGSLTIATTKAATRTVPDTSHQRRRTA
jgi:hypothetical protein